MFIILPPPLPWLFSRLALESLLIRCLKLYFFLWRVLHAFKSSSRYFDLNRNITEYEVTQKPWILNFGHCMNRWWSTYVICNLSMWPITNEEDKIFQCYPSKYGQICCFSLASLPSLVPRGMQRCKGSNFYGSVGKQLVSDHSHTKYASDHLVSHSHS